MVRTFCEHGEMQEGWPHCLECLREWAADRYSVVVDGPEEQVRPDAGQEKER